MTRTDQNKTNKEIEIQFYRASEKPYGVFSNLYKSEINFEGDIYPTAEHAYQAGKPRKEKVKEWMLSAPTAAHVAMVAHNLYYWDIAADWSKVKFDRMRSVLRCKFNQHPQLADILISTEKSVLVECPRTDTPVNRLWGRVNGRGKNTLGIMLMELRDELSRNR